MARDYKLKAPLSCGKCHCPVTLREHSESGGCCYLCAEVQRPRPEAWDENRLGERGYERKETL